jgi:hypothetical protein
LLSYECVELGVLANKCCTALRSSRDLLHQDSFARPSRVRFCITLHLRSKHQQLCPSTV